MLACLASEICSETRGLFSQCLGRNARVLIGTVPGWQAGRDTAPSTDDIAEHWQAIAARPKGLDMPNDAREEMAMVLSHRG